MAEKNEVTTGATFTAAGTAIGTITGLVAGTALASPAAIGAGDGLVICGTVELIKGKK